MTSIHATMTRSRLIGTVAVAAVVAVGTLSLAVFSPSSSANNLASTKADNGDVSTTSTAPTSTTAAPALTVKTAGAVATTSTAAAAKVKTPSRPVVLVAASSLGRLVLIDSSTGKTTRVLATMRAQSDVDCTALGGHVSLSADRKSVYYDVQKGDWESGCEYEIRNVALSGGASTFVTEGSFPAASPDGKTLSYLRKNVTQTVVDAAVTDERVSYDVMVRNISDGSERALVLDFPCNCESPQIAWGADSRHLLVQPLNCGCGGLAYEDIRIVDTVSGSIQTVTGPDPKNSTSQWGEATLLPDGNLFVLDIFLDNFDGKTPGPRMLIIDPSNSIAVKTITTGFADRSYGSTDTDSSGNHLSYISNGNLMVSDNGGRPTQLASGLLDSDW